MICNDKSEKFNRLLSSTAKCDLCQRMTCRKKVLSEYNGNINTKVVFIAEAPGRLGAECCGIPLYGDRTGDNFENLLSNIGWSRDKIFITNSILCNPQDENGNNSTPEKEEIINCSYYLNMVIELINPEIIVTLGIKALEALKLISNHNYELKKDVATVLDWDNRKLYPLYHMGPRAIIHRNLIQQRSDFIKLSNYIDPIKGIKKTTKKLVRKRDFVGAHQETRLVSVVKYIVHKYKEISLFKLTKLLYLIDYDYLRCHKTSMSHAIYLRLQDGPWIPVLKDIVNKEDLGLKTKFINKKPYVLDVNINVADSNLSQGERDFLDEKIKNHFNDGDSIMKTAAYMTEPMKFVLRREKRGENMSKIPVLYQDKTIIEALDA